MSSAGMWPVDPHDDIGLQHREECHRLVCVAVARVRAAEATAADVFLEAWPIRQPEVDDLLAARALSDHPDDDLTIE